MKIAVTNDHGAMSALSDRGHKLSIMIGPNKPADDDSMNSFEVFVTSLGFCIAAMLGNYCERAALDTGPIEVTVNADREEGEHALSALAVEVNVPGEWDERRKAAFHKVAEACPVHQTIKAWEGMEIEIG